MNPYKVVEDFEAALCEYTGATYAVTTTSCTMALMLALKLYRPQMIKVPKFTYVGVPMSVVNAGHEIEWTDEPWLGAYRLGTTDVYDSARWFTKGLFEKVVGEGALGFVCVSFHASKTLGLEQGGAILHNFGSATHDQLLRMRFDGRAPGDAAKDASLIGYHCPMIPSVAAAGLMKLSTMKGKEFDPLPNDDYPDLSQMPFFHEGG